MYFLLSFFCFLLGPCIPARHVVFIWDVQTLIFVYMAFVVYGQYLWLCISGFVYGCVYGHVFTGLYFWICIYGYVFMAMCIWVCLGMCLAMCMAIGSQFSARPGSTNIGAYLSLGPFSTINGTYSSTRPVSTIFWVLFLHAAHFNHLFGSYSLTRPTSTNFGSYSFTRPIWMTLRIFPIFPDRNGKICPSI